MEHEIMGHSKKAVKIWQAPEKKLMEKFKEILTEILIIIFAVSFAAFIERTREHYKEKAEAKVLLTGLKSDLDNEINQIRRSENDMLSMKKSYTLFEKFRASSADSLKKADFKESFFIPKFNSKPLNGRYEGFKSSGKIETIENDSLRNDILKLYQEDMPFIDFSENVFNANQIRLEELIFSNADDVANKPVDVMKLLFTTKGKLILQFSIDYSNAVLTGYDRMIKHANKIKAEISKEDE